MYLFNAYIYVIIGSSIAIKEHMTSNTDYTISMQKDNKLFTIDILLNTTSDSMMSKEEVYMKKSIDMNNLPNEYLRKTLNKSESASNALLAVWLTIISVMGPLIVVVVIGVKRCQMRRCNSLDLTLQTDSDYRPRLNTASDFSDHTLDCLLKTSAADHFTFLKIKRVKEVEDKSDTKTNCVQSTATTATTPTTTTKPPNLSLAPPLRQPAQYESARQNLTPSAVPDYEWPSNEILYRCVYPPPCRVVTDSTPVITPPLSLQRYRSAYSVSPHIPSYCAGMAVSTTASGPDNV